MIPFPAKTMPGQIEDLHDDQEMMGIIIIHEPLFYLYGVLFSSPPELSGKYFESPFGQANRSPFLLHAGCGCGAVWVPKQRLRPKVDWVYKTGWISGSSLG